MTEVARLVTNAEAEGLDPSARFQAYNCMDSALTVGIAQRLDQLLAQRPEEALVYAFERAMQGPAFTMAVRGIAVDEGAARLTLGRLVMAEARVIRALRALAGVWVGEEAAGSLDTAEIRAGLEKGKLGKGFNPHSSKQVPELFYGACGEKAYKRRTKQPPNAGGELAEAQTANEEALTMLQARSPVVGVMAHLVLRARELRKLRGFIAARRSPDGRLRSSFNVGATTSGRWSFSKNCFRDGLNFGNIPKGARAMFVPSEPGWVMVNVDLKQAESYVVALISGDEAYAAAHETGDAHGAVALDVYGEMMPAGADPAKWIREPNAALPHNESPRQACKKLSHGGNYGLGERKASKITGIAIRDIREFREGFFRRYPGVLARIEGMPGRLAANRRFVSCVGRPHRHEGHPGDAETHRAALADEPQGVVADILNVALWRLWRWHDVGGVEPRVRMLSQAYDSVLFECREVDLARVREVVAKAFEVPLTVDGRRFTIPHDFGWGRNWKEACS